MLAIYVNHREGGVVWNESKEFNFWGWRTTHERQENYNTSEFILYIYSSLSGSVKNLCKDMDIRSFFGASTSSSVSNTSPCKNISSNSPDYDKDGGDTFVCL